jgi:hypothetical protein
MEKEAIIKLTENFFKNLKCELNWDGNLLIVNKVPADFVKLYEKASPYIFAFDSESHKNNPDSELITRGSLLLKLMATYLENRAQTTILKINFEPDLRQIIRDNIDLKNYEIASILKEEKNDFIFRFIFMTTLQYLNEKEQIMTQIYINNNKVLENIDINKYPVISGKIGDKSKEKALVEEIKSNYNIAKDNLKTRLQKKTKEITDELSKDLEKALLRVNLHYSKIILELEKEDEKNIENLKISLEKLPKANEKNKPIIEERIKRLEETIKNSKVAEEVQKLQKEKQFFLSDEKNKHSINLNNSLMNTTVIYYPIFNFKLFLKDKTKLKELKFIYNPLNLELSKIFCESCGKEIKELALCDSLHVSCKDCIGVCPRCSKKICKSCEELKCSICGGKICSKCALVCSVCKKHICNSDTRKDSLTGKDICSNCSEFCNSCNKFFSKNSFRQCDNCRKKLCVNCIKSKYVNGKSMKLCNSCADSVKPKTNFSPF